MKEKIKTFVIDGREFEVETNIDLTDEELKNFVEFTIDECEECKK